METIIRSFKVENFFTIETKVNEILEEYPSLISYAIDKTNRFGKLWIVLEIKYKKQD